MEHIDENMTDWEIFQATMVALKEGRVDPNRPVNNDPINNRFSKRVQNLAAGGLVGLGGMSVLPSIGVAAVNAVGFTSSGIAAGSLATVIQSTFYGAYTCGIFSSLQSFGATAVIAPPVALGLGAAAMVVGGSVLAVNKIKERQKEREKEREGEQGKHD
ncbi:hypothetical protein K435DRAFT_778098 [Dendrothele bispora CBS 962.96]|uniref:Uncharacterized protein n=1 Tax=Dendrothele bispora (strain CBS 962.96) TaxID=1314807 RepID=A0A4S8M6G1_DENBC|nr:hypothetical protein K435DRAFT_778098 [Dendrothele bispora CBS 962.96]